MNSDLMKLSIIGGGVFIGGRLMNLSPSPSILVSGVITYMYYKKLQERPILNYKGVVDTSKSYTDIVRPAQKSVEDVKWTVVPFPKPAEVIQPFDSVKDEFGRYRF